MGKGSKRRPQQSSDKHMQSEWDRIFGKKKKYKFVKEETKALTGERDERNIRNK